MAENVMERIVAELRSSGSAHYPEHAELKNVRVVGHTPKSDHYIYDVVIDFADGSERLAAKIYRAGKAGAQVARNAAQVEASHLFRVYKIAQDKNLAGIPRPIGDFSELGAVVSEKLSGIPVQSIIMKAALLPGYADHGTLQSAARMSGEWLQSFHHATSDMPEQLNGEKLMSELEKLCHSCRGEGLDEISINKILAGAQDIVSRNRKPLPRSVVLNAFSPLNIVVGEQGIGFCEYAQMAEGGSSFHDVAQFLACVEALEKYPFCNRAITAEVQDNFLEAYGASADEQQLLRVLKIKALLSMFAQGRNVKESAIRKKVMWANVMKRFIQQAADRSLAPAA
jgi:hypothetical protein